MPVILPPDVTKAMGFLADPQVRKGSRIPAGNVYVFANNGKYVDSQRASGRYSLLAYRTRLSAFYTHVKKSYYPRERQTYLIEQHA